MTFDQCLVHAVICLVGLFLLGVVISLCIGARETIARLRFENNELRQDARVAIQYMDQAAKQVHEYEEKLKWVADDLRQLYHSIVHDSIDADQGDDDDDDDDDDADAVDDTWYDDYYGNANEDE